MALVTVELRNLLKTDFELFDFEYQFDDANMKVEIENAIVNYFYFYEIGDYSPDRFKHNFKVKFLSAIEYYNKLYNTTLLEYDPLINYTMTEALERLGNTKANTTSLSSDQQQTDHTDTTLATDEQQTDHTDTTDALTNSSGTSGSTDSTNQTVDSTETAQTNLSDYPQDTFTGDYSSETSENDFNKLQTTTSTGEQTGENTTETTSKTDGISQTVTTGSRESEQNSQTTNTGTRENEQQSQTDNTESYEKTIEGMTGRTYQELIQLERNNILRIKAMIINELKPCFLMVYN